MCCAGRDDVVRFRQALQAENPHREWDVVEPLADVLLYDSNKEVRWETAWIVGHVGDRRALPALEHAVATEAGYTKGGYSVSPMAQEAIEKIKRRAPTD